jgi:short subunit dehydrogenase-like uncharacterized protein
MRRVIVAGGTGFFGRAMLEALTERDIVGLAASRRTGGDVRLDVENAASLRQALRAGDLVIDTVGPFQDRSTALVEAAIEIGCDVIDLSDSLAYAQRVFALRDKIAAAGVCVLPSCSSVSVVTTMLVADSGIESPVRVSGFLVPSARYSASAATAASLMLSIGRPVQVWRDGRLQEAVGWRPSRRAAFPQPIGRLRGNLFESADSFWLPRIWPTLQTVDLYVDTRVPGLNRALSLAARAPALRRLMDRFQSTGHRLARRLGRRDGCLAVEVQSADGRLAHRAVYCPDHGYRLAVLPAVVAAEALADKRLSETGLILPARQVAAADLATVMSKAGFALTPVSAADAGRV